MYGEIGLNFISYHTFNIFLVFFKECLFIAGKHKKG